MKRILTLLILMGGWLFTIAQEKSYDFVVAEDAETMKSNIDLLDKAFKQSVKDEVNRRLAGNAPKKGLPVDKAITREDFMKMSIDELMDLKRNNPELYNSLK